MEWTNYENKSNKGILYLPEDYDADKEYPVLVQFYETHSGGLNVYHAPYAEACSGRCNVTFVKVAVILCLCQDVHFAP
ncbi:MAG: hypothetical protein ACLVL2_03630 [Bacteroides cellulosilyticus]